jgi:hypothetical protein
MKKSLLLTLLFFIAPYMVYSQSGLNVKASASNLLRYGKGNQNTVTTDSTEEYFEELGDVRLYVNDFLFGVRYEYDDPIEFGTGLKGISRRFIEFKKDNFDVRAGNFYELFGKGLTLNSFESRGLGFNTQFDGIKLNYSKTWKQTRFDGTILGGGLDYNDYLVPGRVETYSVRAANFDFAPIKLFSLGGSYLYTRGAIPSGNYVTNMNAEIYEGNFSFNYKSIDLFASYANKKTITEPNILYPNALTPRGDGAYASLAFTRPGLGITAEYKNYRFNLVTPDERSSTNPTKALPFQVAPTCIKEYSTTLLSRYPHQVDFNDEVGFQLDAFYSPNDNLTFNINGSLSSRHYDYYDADTSALTLYRRIDRNTSYLPSTKDPFSPYWELYFEAEYYVRKDLKVKAAIGRQNSVLYSIVDPASSDKVRTVTIPLEVRYDFMKIYSVELNTEQQWVFNSARTYTPTVDNRNFYNEYISVSVSRSPSIIVNGTVELSTDKEDPSGKKIWGTGEITYKFSSANSLTFSYGSERGGLKCSSGICRYVNPFNGFRLTVINNF